MEQNQDEWALLSTSPPRPAPPILSISDLKSIYWAVRRRPRTLPAVVRMLSRMPRSAVSFRRAVFGGINEGRVVVIAMVECLGDIVAAEPISRLVRRLYPAHRIVWVTKRVFASIPRSFEAVDSVYEVSCLSEWLVLWRLNPQLLVYDLHPVGHYCGECGLPVLKRGTSVSVSDLLDGRDLLTAMCLSGGLPAVDGSPKLVVPEQARHAIDLLGLPDRFIVMHCESTDSRKEWPADKWRAFAEAISGATGLTVFEVGLHAMAARDTSAGLVSLCGRLSIMETAEVIRRATVFVGIDSGPAHLANAVGADAVLLLGAFRSFARYMPFSGGYADGTKGKVIRTDGPAEDIEISEVLNAVSAMLEDSVVRHACFSASDSPAISEIATSISTASPATNHSILSTRP